MDQAIDQGVGGEIKRLRSERDWSMAKLAVEADMSVSGVSMIENGKRNLTTTTLAKLARAFGVEVVDLFPKGQASLPDFENERRESKLLEVADMLLQFGEALLLTWETELPDRARADDDEWLATIVTQWRAFGLINYGILDEIATAGLTEREGWLDRYMGRYMDVNAIVHRINAAVQDHSASGGTSDEERTVLLEPLVAA
jgi:transcriptional regulator with XRE-family HTH domain